MAVATLAMLGTTAASVAPIELTEAAWTDNVYANASFTASPNIGIDYARGLGAYGEFVRDYSLLSDAVAMNGYAATRTTGQSPVTQTNNTQFSSESALLALPFAMSGVRCARAAPPGTECALASTATSYALADVTEFRVHATNPFGVPTTPLVVYEPSPSTNPLRVTTSCNQGALGSTGLAGSGSFTLGSGASTKTLALPTKAAPRKQQVRTAFGFTYRVALLYTENWDINSAWAQVAIHIQTTNSSGDTSWSIDAILARAECGNSKPLPGLPPRPTRTNPAVEWDPSFPIPLAAPVAPLVAPANDAAPSADRVQEGQADSTLEGLPTTAEADPTTSAPPNPSGEAESPTSGASTAAATSMPRRTTTVTRRAPTVTAAPTSATTPPATQVTTSTPVAPAIVIPDEPGTLSPSARLADVDTVMVGDEDHVVVVEGTSLPSDAKQGAAALETWLGGGTARTTWATFASDDAEKDGWRWAAINQKTGTVVYIR